MATADISSSPRAATAARSRRRPRGAAKSSARLQSKVAAISLLALVGTSLLVVVIAAQRPSFLTPLSEHGYFPDWMAGPLRGLWPSLTSSGNRLAWLVSALLAGMFVIYLLAFANAKRLDARWTIAAIVAVHLIFLLAPPLSYTDVFNYVNYGRMGVVHHLNPYATTPLLEPHNDPSFLLSNWHHLLSPYGPLFTLFTYALVPLGVVASFWIIKLLVGLASLTLLALVWRCACALGRNPTSAIAFVGLNPIVLVWGLGADHNDSLMIAVVVLGAYLLIRAPQASRGAGAALVAAVFIKASAAVLLPVFLLAGDRRRFAVGTAAAAAVLGAASLIAFGAHPPDISTQSRLVAALSLPNLFGLALGLSGETAGVRLLFEAALIVSDRRLGDPGRRGARIKAHGGRHSYDCTADLTRLDGAVVSAPGAAVRGAFAEPAPADRGRCPRRLFHPRLHAGDADARRARSTSTPNPQLWGSPTSRKPKRWCAESR